MPSRYRTPMYELFYAAKLEAAYRKLEELKGLIALNDRDYYGRNPEDFNDICWKVLHTFPVHHDDLRCCDDVSIADIL